jgi:hypothetical protein
MVCAVCVGVYQKFVCGEDVVLQLQYSVNKSAKQCPVLFLHGGPALPRRSVIGEYMVNAPFSRARTFSVRDQCT